MSSDPYENQILYDQDEILRVLYGLGNVYWSKHWLVRWLYKPWLDALQTAAMIFAGDKILKEYEDQELAERLSDYLDTIN